MSSRPVLLTVLDILAVLSLLLATYFALVYAPTEAVMGDVQRLFYFHVGTAWVGMLGFVFAAGFGIAYLVTKNLRWDVVSVAAVEISVVFFFLAIVLGSIWARPVWNTWWTWDPRLTTAAITELIFIAYFMLRAGIEDAERRARFGAVYTILGGLSVPITFLAIRLFRTIHPVLFGQAGQGQEQMSMTPDMRVAFVVALIAFTIIFVDLFWHRVRLGRLHAHVEQLKLKTLS